MSAAARKVVQFDEIALRKALRQRQSRRETIMERVVQNIRIDKKTGCWNWCGANSGSGRGGNYPRMSLDGRTVAVHRVMATHAFGYIPSNRQVDHICRNRMCVNPEHLELVTHRENQKRRASAELAAKVFGGVACG